jgi:asparagine synthetase B (glutamine-hydrolysing)
MCGIAGFSGARIEVGDARRTLETMIHTLHHRGPDGYGFHVAPGIGLAHARLSIIDLATGDQPIRNERGDVWTVFNGEIFNYVELRADLIARGHRFYTQSDTEVIVHLRPLRRCLVDHLNGQFAIALWDACRQRLVLARDRAGIRPLFHTRARGGVWFASEIKALFAVLPERATLDPRGLAEALTFWAPADPDTSFTGVHSLPPGHLLAIEADGSETLRQYWDWTFPDRDAAPAFTSIEQATAELRALLVDAVRLQLRADVPVGAYLSGGLDSSGIVAIIRGFTDTPVRTFGRSRMRVRRERAPARDGAPPRHRSHHADRVASPDRRSVPAPRAPRRSARAAHRAGADDAAVGACARGRLQGRADRRRRRRSIRWLRPVPRSQGAPLLGPPAAIALPPAAAWPPVRLSENLLSALIVLAGLETDRRCRPCARLITRLVLSPYAQARPVGRSCSTRRASAISAGDHSRATSMSRLSHCSLPTCSPPVATASLPRAIEGRVPHLDQCTNCPPEHQVRHDRAHLLRRALADLLPDDIVKRTATLLRADSAASSTAGPAFVDDMLIPNAASPATSSVMVGLVDNAARRPTLPGFAHLSTPWHPERNWGRRITIDLLLRHFSRRRRQIDSAPPWRAAETRR